MNKKFSIKEAKELLKKYQSGQCTSRESEIIDRWYNSFDQRDQMDLAGEDALNELKIEMFEGISDKINLAEEKRTIKSSDQPLRQIYFFNFQYLKRIAAILILGAALGTLFYSQSHKDNRESQAWEGNGNDKIRTGDISERALQSTIYLSDGSVVWLKGTSKLEYPNTFTGGIREVTLYGEAFFDVARDPEKPFIIHAANITTRVLGTSFNIKAYGSDEAQEVVVITGQVLVSVRTSSADPVKELLLKPNQKAIYSKKDNSLVESAANEREIETVWDKSKLVFDETPLQDIIKVLNAAHGVKISLSNEGMKDCMITADLKNESLDVSMAILAKALNATYAIDGKDVIFTGNGCGTQR